MFKNFVDMEWLCVWIFIIYSVFGKIYNRFRNDIQSKSLALHLSMSSLYDFASAFVFLWFTIQHVQLYNLVVINLEIIEKLICVFDDKLIYPSQIEFF